MSIKLRRLSVVRAYVSVLQSRGRGFTPEKIVTLLEGLGYVLLQWVEGAVQARNKWGGKR